MTEDEHTHRAEQKRLRGFIALRELDLRLTAAPDLQTTYDLAVEAVVHLLVEIDPAAAELVLVAKAGAATAVLTVGRRTPLDGGPPGRGVLARVFRTGQTYLNNHAAEDPLYVRWEAIPPGSELCVPIRMAGEVIGALNVEEPFAEAFTPTDCDMMESLDGTGYPRALKGEAIPLAARLFAVVDVWDALTSDRLYRAAWPQAKARAYLRGQAGRLFEPRIVEMFLALIAEEGRPAM